MTSSNQAPQHPAALTGEGEAAAKADAFLPWDKQWMVHPHSSGAQNSRAI